MIGSSIASSGTCSSSFHREWRQLRAILWEVRLTNILNRDHGHLDRDHGHLNRHHGHLWNPHIARCPSSHLDCTNGLGEALDKAPVVYRPSCRHTIFLGDENLEIYLGFRGLGFNGESTREENGLSNGKWDYIGVYRGVGLIPPELQHPNPTQLF